MSKNTNLKREVWGIGWMALAGFLFFCLFFPQNAGEGGRILKGFLFDGLGKGSYLLAFYLAYWGYKSFRNSQDRTKAKLLAYALSLWAICILLSLFSQFIGKPNLGGAVGKFSAQLLCRLTGGFGATMAAVGTLILSIMVGLNTSLYELLQTIKNRIKEDLAAARIYRKNFRTELQKKIEEKRIQKITLKKPPKEPVIKELLKPAEFKEPPELKIVTAKLSPAGQTVSGRKIPAKTGYQLPPLDLLDLPAPSPAGVSEEELKDLGKLLEKTLASFNVQAQIIEINPGPVITRYDITPAPGIKVQSIINLSNDLALALQVPGVRIIAPVPGKAAVGIEVPNKSPAVVKLREALSGKKFQQHESKLLIGLGKTTSGEIFVADLSSMPHLLIAGATGSGKSLCIHSIIMSILYKATPKEVKFLMIDPKRLELPGYNDIPHLYDPGKGPKEVKVITDSKEAAKSLLRLTKIMEQRYEKFAKSSVRNIEGYNRQMLKEGKDQEFYIVVIIDELADLMLVACLEVEESITRLAQMARAVGIHLVLATQRPSVDVLTGVIKANLPARIALQVLSKVDSRVILDTQGAEDLIGRGDLLFLPTGAPRPIRIQGSHISEKEVERVVNFIKVQANPDYEEIVELEEQSASMEEDAQTQELLIQAAKLARDLQHISGDILRARIGSQYDLILNLMKVQGLIYKPEGARSWKINMQRIEEFLSERGSILGTRGSREPR
ncbi:MAG: DNA translocase FtsK 4TM domain-containing protein [Elusimicrobiota bacterium]